MIGVCGCAAGVLQRKPGGAGTVRGEEMKAAAEYLEAMAKPKDKL
jgi:hypothetical protein